MSMTREYVNGKNSVTFINGDGKPLLAQSSQFPEAKIDSGARAVYGSLAMNLADFDKASPKLRHKCREIAIAVLDAAERFENHYP